MLASKRAALRPIAIRQLQEQDKSDQVTRGDGIEQELAMLDDLEQSLNAEIKTISEGNQSLTVKTLDLQALQDEVAQMQDVRGQGRIGGGSSQRRAGGAPPNPDHRGCRRPSHQGREKTVDDRSG